MCQEVWLLSFPVLVHVLRRPNKHLIWCLLRGKQHLSLDLEPAYPAHPLALVSDDINKCINPLRLPWSTWSQVTLGPFKSVSVHANTLDLLADIFCAMLTPKTKSAFPSNVDDLPSTTLLFIIYHGIYNENIEEIKLSGQTKTSRFLE